ncbi:MAG: glycosyltransferase [Nitrososphaerales archaeon]
MLEIFALTLGAIHFALPLAYYIYLKRYLNKPWGLKIDKNHMPMVSIIVPTYNEAFLINRKLDDILKQDYPKEKMEIIVVDSASIDGTLIKVKQWKEKHKEISLNIIEENERKGKAQSLNTALKHVNNEIIVLTDADSFWDKESLKESVKYFSDNRIGAVTAIKEPILNSRSNSIVESTYRSFYNLVRVAESKIHSTPIFHGELAAFRRELIDKIGGFSMKIGADDSHSATLIALRGYRAIAAKEVLAYELTPRSWRSYFTWRIRRGKHLIQHFLKSLRKILKAPKGFKMVLAIESFLHLFNPWLLLIAIILFIVSIVINPLSFLNLTIIFTLLVAILVKYSRKVLFIWILNQVILIYSMIAGIRSKEIIWKKIEELRDKTIEM